MTIYEYGNPEAEVVLIQPVGDHDLQTCKQGLSVYRCKGR